MASPPRLRGYVVERPLGSGASGDVWQARTAAGVRVALKRIAIRDDEQLRRAQAEAGLLGALEHANLVRLHTAVPADDALVLVLDLAEGGSLAQLLLARGRLSAGETITAIAPVAAALDYLHGEGVVHGDVSAANILFTRAGVPLLADIGVARLTGDIADAEATPAYVDPAVAAGCVPGPQSDVFMLAAVALHAVTGAPVWRDDDADAALARAARGVLGDVGERLAAAGAPAAMSAVLLRALAVDPQRRGTAAALALDLAHSAAPAAVELAAGLPRPEPQLRSGPRHAASPGAVPNRSFGWLGLGQAAPARMVRGDAAAGQIRADAARPAFERPERRTTEAESPPAGLPPGGSAESGSPLGASPLGASPPGSLPPPTRLVARPRPAIPRPRRRRLPGSRIAKLVGIALLAGLLAVGVTAAALVRHTGHRSAASKHRVQVETSGAQGGHSTPDAQPAAIDWAAALLRLDERRGAAFRDRNPALLRQVYVPGPLLSADTALLTRLVPPGCGLSGVRTSYAQLHVAATPARAVVTARASLAPSRLLCPGRARGRAPGVTAALRVVLTETPDGIRIAAERRDEAGP